jgi:hypothetical protein
VSLKCGAWGGRLAGEGNYKQADSERKNTYLTGTEEVAQIGVVRLVITAWGMYARVNDIRCGGELVAKMKKTRKGQQLA